MVTGPLTGPCVVCGADTYCELVTYERRVERRPHLQWTHQDVEVAREWRCMGCVKEKAI